MIAREGAPFIVSGVLITLFALWAAIRWDSWWLLAVTALVLLATLFTTFFFRDPPRRIAPHPDALLAPADGRILTVETVENHAVFGGSAIKLSIFLSIFDVHINRMPFSGTIRHVSYHPGKFLAAYKDKASDLNENTETHLITSHGVPIVIRQIAGLIARRIVCRVQPGDTVTAGDRFGMIRFGSRTELIVPRDSEVCVKAGEHVRAGVTVVGKLKSREPLPAPLRSEQGRNAKL
ncbi:MAG TPA: phosphatidylserine decarboxylase family protein [Candidatus Deferrimicrobium sp.]|nr:phosphatidylserine decarboxylase family protein [Candidatus Deferrimicrobium sp.]